MTATEPTAPAAVVATAVSPPAIPATTVWRPAPRRALVSILIVVVGACCVGVILAAWSLPPFDRGDQVTDNAYVHGRTTVIAPQVSGYVTDVKVHDFEEVAAGQILVTIDDRVYRARLEQAQANLDSALSNLRNSTQAHAVREAALRSQIAAFASTRAQLDRARADMTRADNLSTDGSLSIRERDQTIAALRQTEAQVSQAGAGIEIARQDIRTVDVGRSGLQALVEAARAQLHAASIDLEHTVVRAPEAGQLGEVGVRTGVYVTNGTQLLSLVPGDRWLIANFKEAQTARMAPGQPVRFTVDALSGESLRGHVQLLAPATGSEFAVLKPDNATGNFVKVPQRLGVRIAIDPGQAGAARLRPGMSVEVRVDTTTR